MSIDKRFESDLPFVIVGGGEFVRSRQRVAVLWELIDLTSAGSTTRRRAPPLPPLPPLAKFSQVANQSLVKPARRARRLSSRARRHT